MARSVRSSIGLACVGAIAMVAVVVFRWIRAPTDLHPRISTDPTESADRRTIHPRAPVELEPLQPSRQDEPGPRPASIEAAEALALELGLDLEPSVEDGLELIAVDESSGEPIEGALLILSAYKPGPQFRITGQPPAPHRLGFPRHSGSGEHSGAFVTDTAGRALVPRLVARTRVIAFHPEFHGSKLLRDGDISREIVGMTRTRLVRARVLDQAGRPRGGIPVEATDPANAKTRISPPLVSRDGDGSIEAHPFELMPPPRGAFEQLRIGLALPTLEDVSRVIDPLDPPADPITLVLPPTGSISIRIVDPSGALVEDSQVIWDAGVADRIDSADARSSISRSSRRRQSIELKDGTGRIAPVGLGLAFILDAYSSAGQGTTRIIAGPSTADEDVQVTLTVDDPPPCWVGRAMKVDGEPFARRVLGIHLIGADGDPSRITRNELPLCETDENGTFRQPMFREIPPQSILEIDLLDERTSSPSHRARCTIGSPRGGVVDLGDVVLERLPLLVAGIVVDGDGRPVEAVDLSVVSADLPTGTLRAVTDAMGRFEVCHFPIAGACSLTASHAFLRERAPTPFDSGQEDVRIVLTPIRKVRVTTILDWRPPAWTIRLEWRPSAPDIGGSASRPATGWRWGGALDADGTVCFEPEETQRLDVRFLAKDVEREPIELLTIEGVVLPDDPSAPVSELTNVDLRGRVVLTTLRLRSEDGAPIGRASVSIAVDPEDSAGDERRFLEFETDALRSVEEVEVRGWGARLRPTIDGDLVVVTARAGSRVEVDSPGFQPEIVEAVAGSIDVDLRRALRVPIRVACGVRIAAPFHLRVSLEPMDGPAGGAGSRAVRWDRMLDAAADAPGRHRIRVTIARFVRDGRLLEREVAASPEVLEIGSESAASETVVTLDEGAVLAFMESYRGSTGTDR